MELSPVLTNLLWAIALGVVPAAAIVATICSLCIRRAATRHALWFVVLLLFITPLFALLPGAPRLPSPLAAPAYSLANEPGPSFVPHEKLMPLVSKPKSADPAPSKVASVEPVTPSIAKRVAPIAPSTPPTARSTPSRVRGAPQKAAPPQFAESRSIPSVLPRSGFILPPESAGVTAAPAGKQSPSVPQKSSSAQRLADIPTARSAPTRRLEMAPEHESPLAPVSTMAPPLAAVAGAVPAESAAHDSKLPTLSALSAEFDHYFARLVGVRDAVAAVPPPPSELWLTGVLLILACGVFRTAFRRRACGDLSLADIETRLLVTACAKRLGLRRLPRVSMTDQRVSPLVTCGMLPRIILPRPLWRVLDDRSRQAVLLHELTHLRRGDHRIRWIEQIVTLAYWWHPVVWWVRARLRDEADLCCDAWVTTLLPAARRSYAEALVTTRAFLNQRTDPAPAYALGMASARSRRFARRLTMVMTQNSGARTSPIGVLLAVTVAAAGTFVLPSLACPNEKPQSEAASAPAVAIVTVRGADAPQVLSIGSGKVVRAGKSASPRVAPTPPVPPAPPAPPVSGSDDSSFEQYMKSRGSADGDDLSSLEARVARLEKALLARSAGGKGQSYTFAMPSAPTPPTPPAMVFIAPKAPKALSTTPAVVGSDGTVAMQYALPKGKLKELSSLMARSDVPILVRPGDKAITVYATPEQHGSFKAFLLLIHPDGVTIIREDGEKESHSRLHDHEGLHEAHAEDKAAIEGKVKAEMDAKRAEMEAVRQHMRDAQRQARDSERARTEVERHRERIERQAEQLRQKAEQLHKSHKERGPHSDANSQLEREFAEQAAALELEAAELERSAAECEAQAEAVECDLEQWEAQADSLEDLAESLSEEIAEMMEQFEVDFDDDRDSEEEV